MQAPGARGSRVLQPGAVSSSLADVFVGAPVVSADARLTEAGDTRITEAGDRRVTES